MKAAKLAFANSPEPAVAMQVALGQGWTSAEHKACSGVTPGPVVLFQDYQRDRTLDDREIATLHAGCHSTSRNYREQCSGNLDPSKAASNADSWAAYDRGRNTRSKYLRVHSSVVSIPDASKPAVARRLATLGCDFSQLLAHVRGCDVWRIHLLGPLRTGPCTPRYHFALTATQKQWLE